MADFQGYHRPNGRVGIRNRLLVLSVGGLTGPVARRIAAGLEGAACVVLPYEAGLIGDDKEAHDRAALGLASNPNVGAVLLVGDNPSVLARIDKQLAPNGTARAVISMDECGNNTYEMTARALRSGAALVREMSRMRRKPAPLSALVVGLECGRSDSSSGLVANPLVGHASDRLIKAGATTILGETTEWLGAEHLLAKRARTPQVKTQIVDAVTRREQTAATAGVDMLGTNPTPTNIAAGLSTIEEKSLGSTAKSGSATIEGVLSYGEAPGGNGLWLMDAPAYAPESLTGFVAAGAQVILFTTGVGNSYVSALAPTIKISANPENAAALEGQLDFDARAGFEGTMSLDTLADSLMDVIGEIAGGTRTWGEILGEGDEIVSRFGAAL